ncbi:MAG: MCP four helix bundle domain-containing protein [Cyclobacteriaceae bacterium]|nr:MCP four helix bundle domain-containing protein [Cyclobacteriaceae bacterium]
MKWIYGIRQKAQVAFLLAIILVGILVKNIMERNNVSELGDSFSSVYEDRLVVESYIYQLSGHLYQKKLIFDNCTAAGDVMTYKNQLDTHNSDIANLIHEYEKTKFTEKESAFFQSFKNSIRKIIFLENEYWMSSRERSNPELDEQFKLAATDLQHLSAIQLAEGKILSDQSKKIVAGSTLLTQFEAGMIVVMGLIIQALVFASRSIVPKVAQNHLLN